MFFGALREACTILKSGQYSVISGSLLMPIYAHIFFPLNCREHQNLPAVELTCYYADSYGDVPPTDADIQFF